MVGVVGVEEGLDYHSSSYVYFRSLKTLTVLDDLEMAIYFRVVQNARVIS